MTYSQLAQISLIAQNNSIPSFAKAMNVTIQMVHGTLTGATTSKKIISALDKIIVESVKLLGISQLHITGLPKHTNILKMIRNG